MTPDTADARHGQRTRQVKRSNQGQGQKQRGGKAEVPSSVQWPQRAGRGRRQRWNQGYPYFKLQMEIGKREKGKYYMEQDSTASSTSGWRRQQGQHGFSAQGQQGQWATMSAWHVESNKSNQHRQPGPHRSGRSRGQRSPKESSLPYSTSRKRQSKAAHPTQKCYYCTVLGAQTQQCCWMLEGNSTQPQRRNLRYWNIQQHRWTSKFPVPPRVREVLATLLRPMNLWGWCARGMCAPRNSTQFIMNQVYQDMRKQEKEAASQDAAALSNGEEEELSAYVLRENSNSTGAGDPAPMVPYPFTAQNKIATEEGEEESGQHLKSESFCQADIQSDT